MRATLPTKLSLAILLAVSTLFADISKQGNEDRSKAVAGNLTPPDRTETVQALEPLLAPDSFANVAPMDSRVDQSGWQISYIGSDRDPHACRLLSLGSLIRE